MDPRTQNKTLPERCKIHMALYLFAFLMKRDFFKTHAQIKEAYTPVDPRTRARALPERGKIHLSLYLFCFLNHFLAAQVPTGSIITSVACGPHTPRPKDCPGLGDPNTLK